MGRRFNAAAVGPPALTLPAAATALLLLLCPAIAAMLFLLLLPHCMVVVVPPVRAVAPRPVRDRRRHALPPPLQAGVEQVLHQHDCIHADEVLGGEDNGGHLVTLQQRAQQVEGVALQGGTRVGGGGGAGQQGDTTGGSGPQPRFSSAAQTSRHAARQLAQRSALLRPRLALTSSHSARNQALRASADWVL